MLESADACWVGLAAVWGDVLESTNYILKKGYNGHDSSGWGAMLWNGNQWSSSMFGNSGF